MTMKRIAVVSGANRGLGLEICRQLAMRNLAVILTARDENKGIAAAKRLREAGLDVSFHQLDVTDRASVERLARDIEAGPGRWDVLVNNAGVLFDRGKTSADIDLETFKRTMDVNFYGVLMLSQAAIPLMRRQRYGRIVNVVTDMASLQSMEAGYPAYRVSKTSVNALTRVMGAELAGGNILVNSASPGWVRTDMGGPGAPLSVEQGADTAVWLATLPDGGPSGGFFRDRKPFPW